MKDASKRLLSMLLLFAVALGAAANTVDFELPDLEGKLHRLSDYRGKWIVVNYWATWCPPCLEEMPELEMFHINHKDKDAVVLGVNMETIDASELREFVEQQFISYPVLREKPALYTELGQVSGMPTTFLVAPDGHLAARQVGQVTATMLENTIREYKQHSAPGYSLAKSRETMNGVQR